MSAEIAQLAILIVFALNAALIAGLVALKTVNRTRRTRAKHRRRHHMRLISKHVSVAHCTDPITPKMATDPAFLDALIDVRNALVGAEVESLKEIVARHGILERHAARLRSPFPLGRRLQAAVVLAELGNETAAPVLLEHLTDREPEIRIQAARGLGRMRWTPAIDSIVSRFGVETPWVRARFADVLIGFGTAATFPILAYIRINQGFESAGPVAAIRALAAVGDEQSAPYLIKILREADDPEVVLAAVETLGVLSNPLAVPVLRTMAGSPDWRIRAKAVSALGHVGDPATADLLADALTDREWWVRRNAATALIRVRGGLDCLYDALVGPDRSAADAAAEALADHGDLAESRHQLEEGTASISQRALVRHMEGVS